MDHSGGALSMLEAMDVGWVSSSLPASHPVIEASREHRRCEAGQHWEWDGVRFDMLHPSPVSYETQARKPNTISCTLKVTLDVNSSMLLTGDIEAAQELELLGRAPEHLLSTVLLAPHHGSGTSSSPAFLEAVSPELALFQVGYRNRYQHPKREVFERYAELGIRRLRSDESGAVTLRFGRELEVIDFRKQRARYWHGR
jgi:competence protein ComEC